VSGSGKGGAGVFCASGPAGSSGPNWSGCSTSYGGGMFCTRSQDYGRKGKGVPSDGTYSGSCKAVAAGAASWARVSSPAARNSPGGYCASAMPKPPGGKDAGGINDGNYYNTLAKAQAACAALGPACGGASIHGSVSGACSQTSGGYWWRLCKARGSKTFSFTSSNKVCA